MLDIKGPAHPNYLGDEVQERIIVGLSGYARTGKDEVAKVLVEEFGFTRFAFADKLRDCLYALNPKIGSITEYDEHTGVSVSPIRLSQIIDKHGWNGYKETPYGNEIRALLQRMGTEVGRDLIAEDVWVCGLDEQVGRIVVADARFPNEADRIYQNDGMVFRVERSGVTAINAHVSETALDHLEFDHCVKNDGTLEDLRNTVRGFAKEYGW